MPALTAPGWEEALTPTGQPTIGQVWLFLLPLSRRPPANPSSLNASSPWKLRRRWRKKRASLRQASHPPYVLGTVTASHITCFCHKPPRTAAVIDTPFCTQSPLLEH